MESNEIIFDPMLTDINYSNYLEAVVNGTLFSIPSYEVKKEGKQEIAVQRKTIEKTIETEQLATNVEKEVLEKSTQSESGDLNTEIDTISIQSIPKSQNNVVYQNYVQFQKRMKLLRVS